MIQLKATKVFYRNLNSKAKVVLNRGGARSSKSYSILQVLIYKFLTEEKKKFLIMRKTFPSLRITTWYDFKKIISELGIEHKIKEEKKFFNYYYKDNFLHFGSLDDVEKIKSSSWNYIFLEEATEFDYEEYVTLKLRLSAPSVDGKRNQMFLAFNPIDENHW
ncbi:MAG: phage terminase large subunit, partial [Thermodesulfovibrio sp.]|nr:phage terminase large subunit [Thermodesulfovibrio sp.]